jgi:AP-3 complex subunit delta-1
LSLTRVFLLVKYISLLALVKIVPYYPNLAAEYQDLILTGMDDTDISIRIRSLELLSAMVDRTNIQSIVQHLLTHLLKSQSATPQVESAAHALAKTVSGASTSASGPSPGLTPSYRLAVANSVIEMCHTTGHENPEWLLSVYVDLTYVARANVGRSIKECILDIVLKQPASQQQAVKLMNKLLDDDVFLLNANEPGSCAEVLSAAAWVCGEYAT